MSAAPGVALLGEPAIPAAHAGRGLEHTQAQGCAGQGGGRGHGAGRGHGVGGRIDLRVGDDGQRGLRAADGHIALQGNEAAGAIAPLDEQAISIAAHALGQAERELTCHAEGKGLGDSQRSHLDAIGIQQGEAAGQGGADAALVGQ